VGRPPSSRLPCLASYVFSVQPWVLTLRCPRDPETQRCDPFKHPWLSGSQTRPSEPYTCLHTVPPRILRLVRLAHPQALAMTSCLCQPADHPTVLFWGERRGCLVERAVLCYRSASLWPRGGPIEWFPHPHFLTLAGVPVGYNQVTEGEKCFHSFSSRVPVPVRKPNQWQR
jgi:hypothetical protein